MSPRRKPSRTVLGQVVAHPMPDWTNREAVAEFAAAGAEIRGDDPVVAWAVAAHIWDRTPGTTPAVQMANQMGTVFSKHDCEPRWRERLPEIAVPTLVVHGRRNPLFPVGNGEAIAREIPAARLIILEEAATAIPDAAAGKVAGRCSRSGREPVLGPREAAAPVLIDSRVGRVR